MIVMMMTMMKMNPTMMTRTMMAVNGEDYDMMIILMKAIMHTMMMMTFLVVVIMINCIHYNLYH